ncbi:MAG: hypothetical protein A2Z15_08640 [Chloroflexi bacterium RBG_16_50_11]|nr:MAG: hypothetical protein A2Z15_08640 [Chloroflexi bacterium RBG_16_50_11]
MEIATDFGIAITLRPSYAKATEGRQAQWKRRGRILHYVQNDNRGKGGWIPNRVGNDDRIKSPLIPPYEGGRREKELDSDGRYAHRNDSRGGEIAAPPDCVVMARNDSFLEKII